MCGNTLSPSSHSQSAIRATAIIAAKCIPIISPANKAIAAGQACRLDVHDLLARGDLYLEVVWVAVLGLAAQPWDCRLRRASSMSDRFWILLPVVGVVPSLASMVL